MARTKKKIEDPVTRYAQRVVGGKVVAGPHVRAQCQRHLDDLVNGPKRGLRWNLELAKKKLAYFPDVLRLSDGQFEGIPFKLHESQEFIVGSMHGWQKETEDHGWVRRFNRAYIEEGKGNGKSPLAAGLGLQAQTADDEPGAQIYAAAAKRDQAMIIFKDAVKFRDKSPALRKRLVKSGQNPTWKLTWLDKASTFEPISRDAGKTGSGPRPHWVLCDELHELTNRSIVDILERGFKFRRQPMLMMITNSGSDRNSVCWEEHQLAIQVAAQEYEYDEMFTYVCALDEGDDPLNDPSCWIKANPLLGTILTEEYLQGVVDQAKALPGKMNSVLRLHFCVWTDAETAWVSSELWEQCEDEGMKLEDFEGQDAYLGLDLGATKDLSGVSVLFHDGWDDEDRPKFALFCKGFTPKETMLERAKKDEAPYDVWADAGHLIATPGKVVRHDYIVSYIDELSQVFTLKSIAYDKWLIRKFEEIVDEGGFDWPLVEHPQGVNRRKDSPLWMPESVNMFEELLIEGRLRIAVNPALRSAVAAATFWTSPAGLKRFEKSKAHQRIDLAVSSAMAIGAAVSGDTFDKNQSVFEKRGIRSLDGVI